MEDDEAAPLGWVPVEARGSLPFALVHGESLVASASWAMGEAGVQLVDFGTDPEEVRRAGRALVLHDPLCPLTPADFIVEAIEAAEESGQVVAGYRSVTDTVKELDGALDGGRLGATVDRDELVIVTSPVVVPRELVGQLAALDTDDFPRLVDGLAQRFGVRLLPAPALGRRVHDEDDLRVLEALSRAAG